MRPQRKKAVDLSDVSINDYLVSQSKPNGNGGFKAFWKSNLFVSLVIFFLGQAFIIGGVLVTNYWRTTSLMEWRGSTEVRLDKMDSEGTVWGRQHSGEIEKAIKVLESTVNEMQASTSHLDVADSERRRITKDLEDLKKDVEDLKRDGKK